MNKFSGILVAAVVLLLLLSRELADVLSLCVISQWQKKALQGVIKVAQEIFGCPLPSLEELHNTHCLRKAQNILCDSSHPNPNLFEFLPSGIQ